MRFWEKKETEIEVVVEVPYNPYRNLLRDNGREAFLQYLDAELQFMAEDGYSEDENCKAFRNDAVIFIAQQYKCQNFDAFIPFMAMTYFDRVISKHRMPNEVVSTEEDKTLFLICCLTIAWKLRTNTFDLSKFLSERTFTYEINDVLKMELYICQQLDWQIRTLTPIFFAEYFISLLCLPPEYPSPHQSINQLIVKSQAEIALTDYRPSVVAASSVLTVSSKMFPDQANAFESRIQSSEFLDGKMGMFLKCNEKLKSLLKCNEKLASLYRCPNMPAAEDRSNLAGKPATRGSTSSAMRKPAEQKLIAGQTSGSLKTKHEAKSSRIVGKKLVVCEVEANAEESENETVQPIDELMNFKLGWTEEEDYTTDDTVSRALVQGGDCTHFAAYLLDKVNVYCFNVKDRVNNMCNIL